MKKIDFLCLALVAMQILVGCGRQDPDKDNGLVFAPVLYVKDFPKEVQLAGKEAVDPDVIGIKNFAIYDSIIVFSTSGLEHLWFFSALPSLAPLGSFLKTGQGPFEFVRAPSVGNKTSFKRENGNLCVYIYDFYRGKLLRMNVDRSIKNKKLEISVFRDSIPPFLFDFAVVDDSTYYGKEINSEETAQMRFIEKNGVRTQPDFLQKLNNNFISKGEDFNILSTVSKFNPTNKRVVEMPVGLNFIHVFSLDGSFARTICPETRVDNIAEIERTKHEDRVYTFTGLRQFDNFFGAVHVDEYRTGREKLPSILLFDWDGSPLAKWKLDHHITMFDIDMPNGHLYTFDVHSDEFFRYDVKEILERL